MRIEQNGSESAELSSNNNVVIVQVPVTVPGEVSKSGIGSRFSIGSFQGRETTLLRATGTQAQLIFRIPREHFRPSALEPGDSREGPKGLREDPLGQAL